MFYFLPFSTQENTMKILCILLPHFPLVCEHLRQPAIKGRPALVFSSSSSRRTLFDFSPGLEGLTPGMPLERAIALHGGAETISADLPYYRDMFERVLDSLQQVSPLVEGGTEGTVYMGTNGLELLYPGDGDLTRAVREAVCDDFEIRMGQAEGKFPAYLAAERSQPGECTSLNGSIEHFLEKIPSRHLPVSARSRERLAGFGLATIGQVAALPSSALEAQFGPEGKIIHRLANGTDDSPLVPRLPREIITESLEMESPTSLAEVLLAGFECLLSRVFTGLTARGTGISRLDLIVRTTSGECREKSVFFKSPVMEIKAAIKRIGHVLETWPQPGPAEQLSIRITGTACPLSRQKSLLPEVKSTDHLLGEISQLELKLGSPQLFKFKEAEPWSRIPERRHVLTPLNM
jgi:DNA polymerase-4/protein ImuB